MFTLNKATSRANGNFYDIYEFNDIYDIYDFYDFRVTGNGADIYGGRICQERSAHARASAKKAASMVTRGFDLKQRFKT